LRGLLGLELFKILGNGLSGGDSNRRLAHPTAFVPRCLWRTGRTGIRAGPVLGGERRRKTPSS
jgi:hypothetical protein